MVEDCGPVINPAIVDGQVRGGVAQGIGAVLYEKAAYDDDANMQAATYMDYLLPTAMEIPDIEVHHLETSPGGERLPGLGEGGMIGAPAAITNAIEDAWRPSAPASPPVHAAVAHPPARTRDRPRLSAHRKFPHPVVTFAGIAMGATVVSDEAEQKIVAFADRVFPAFLRYRQQHG